MAVGAGVGAGVAVGAGVTVGDADGSTLAAGTTGPLTAVSTMSWSVEVTLSPSADTAPNATTVTSASITPYSAIAWPRECWLASRTRRVPAEDECRMTHIMATQNRPTMTR